MSIAQGLKLKPAFSDEQAQALVGLFDEEAATKRDVAALAADVAKLKSDLARLDLSLRAEIDKLRIGSQRYLKGTEGRLATWVVGQGVATIGILFGLLHFFGK